MIAVDTNVLIYGHREETEWHGPAMDRLVALAEGDEPWVLPVFCITEFLRVVTHLRVFGPPSSGAEALAFIADLLDAPACSIAYPETDFLPRLAAVIRESDARGNLIFDAQIAALCKSHGASTIVTNDRDFERFTFLRVEYLAPPQPGGDAS